MPERYLLAIRTGRHHPHEVLIHGFCIIGGILFSSGVARSQVLNEAVSDAVRIGWAIALLVSGVVGLTGCYWRGQIRVGLLLERAALAFGSAAAIVYLLALVTAAGWGATGAGLWIGAYVAANLARVHGITGDLRILERLSRPGLGAP